MFNDRKGKRNRNERQIAGATVNELEIAKKYAEIHIENEDEEGALREEPSRSGDLNIACDAAGDDVGNDGKASGGVGVGEKLFGYLSCSSSGDDGTENEQDSLGKGASNELSDSDSSLSSSSSSSSSCSSDDDDDDEEEEEDLNRRRRRRPCPIESPCLTKEEDCSGKKGLLKRESLPSLIVDTITKEIVDKYNASKDSKLLRLVGKALVLTGPRDANEFLFEGFQGEGVLDDGVIVCGICSCEENSSTDPVGPSDRSELLPLGVVTEVLGPVTKPIYCVKRFQAAGDNDRNKNNDKNCGDDVNPDDHYQVDPDTDPDNCDPSLCNSDPGKPKPRDVLHGHNHNPNPSPRMIGRDVYIVVTPSLRPPRYKTLSEIYANNVKGSDRSGIDDEEVEDGESSSDDDADKGKGRGRGRRNSSSFNQRHPMGRGRGCIQRNNRKKKLAPHNQSQPPQSFYSASATTSHYNHPGLSLAYAHNQPGGTNVYGSSFSNQQQQQQQIGYYNASGYLIASVPQYHHQQQHYGGMVTTPPNQQQQQIQLNMMQYGSSYALAPPAIPCVNTNANVNADQELPPPPPPPPYLQMIHDGFKLLIFL